MRFFESPCAKGYCPAHYQRFRRHGDPLSGRPSRGQDRKRHPLFYAWKSLKDRCSNPRHHKYANYGGRGIKVHETWRRDFWRFAADMGPKPSPKHSIERIDNERGYEPGNCRWATAREQSRNMRTNRRITAFGRTLIVRDWGIESGISDSTITGRLKRGLTPEAAVSPILPIPPKPPKPPKPPRVRRLCGVPGCDRIHEAHDLCKKHYKFARNHNGDPLAERRPRGFLLAAFGRAKIISAWAKEVGISKRTIRKRLKRGWTPEQAIRGFSA